MAGVGLVRLGGDLALYHKLIIVEVAAVRRYAEVIAHVLGTKSFFFGYQRFIELLAVAGVDNLDFDNLDYGISKQLLKTNKRRYGQHFYQTLSVHQDQKTSSLFQRNIPDIPSPAFQ